MCYIQGVLIRYAFIGLLSAPLWLYFGQLWYMGVLVSPFFYLVQVLPAAADFTYRHRTWSYPAVDFLAAVSGFAVTYPLWIHDRLIPALVVFCLIYFPASFMAAWRFEAEVTLRQQSPLSETGGSLQTRRVV